MRSDTEPIPVSDALKLCEMALADCDKATEAPWRDIGFGVVRGGPLQDYTNGKADDQIASVMIPNRDNAPAIRDQNSTFIVLSRAVMRPMISAVRELICRDDGSIDSTADIYPALAALKSHYDRTRPEWRSR